MDAANEPIKQGNEILVRGWKGAGASVAGVGQVEEGPDGYLHFSAEHTAAAAHINSVLRGEEKAERIFAERAKIKDQREHGAGRLESAIMNAVGDKQDLAATVTATVMGLMPAMMEEMRKQVKAETEAAMAAANTGKGGKSQN